MESSVFNCDQCGVTCQEVLLLKIKGKPAQVQIWDDVNEKSAHLCQACLKKALHF